MVGNARPARRSGVGRLGVDVDHHPPGGSPAVSRRAGGTSGAFHSSRHGGSASGTARPGAVAATTCARAGGCSRATHSAGVGSTGRTHRAVGANHHGVGVCRVGPATGRPRLRTRRKWHHDSVVSRRAWGTRTIAPCHAANRQLRSRPCFAAARRSSRTRGGHAPPVAAIATGRWPSSVTTAAGVVRPTGRTPSKPSRRR